MEQVGPRLELEIVKVEEGLCDGRVLFHKYQQRSATEKALQQAEWDEKAALRDQRRRQQVGCAAAGLPACSRAPSLQQGSGLAAGLFLRQHAVCRAHPECSNNWTPPSSCGIP